MKRLTLLSATAILFACSQSLQAEGIVNGSFESGDLTGWESDAWWDFGDASVSVTDNGASDGTYSANLYAWADEHWECWWDPDTGEEWCEPMPGWAEASLTQEFTANAGDQLSFDHRSDFGGWFDAYVQNTDTNDYTWMDTGGDLGWRTVSHTISEGGNYRLHFSVFGEMMMESDAQIDNVRLIHPDSPTVVERHIFYSDSAFGDAIAFDKRALLPGETASFENYTSYSRGVNGLMIDLADASNAPLITADDFEFRVGTDANLDSWQDVPNQQIFDALGGSLELRPEQGVDQSDRLVLNLPDGLFANGWVEVTLKATPATGLPESDVFFVGNAVGETGNSDRDSFVNAADVIGVRDNSHDFSFGIDDPYDFDRNDRVDATDVIMARDNMNSPLNALRLICVPGPAPPIAAAPVPEPSTLALAAFGLLGFLVFGRRR